MSDDPFQIVGTTQASSYQVEAMVGEGGFAVVYRAHHTAFRATVALKCLKVPEGLTAEQKRSFLERFREEGELLFRLSSVVPSVVRPLHVGLLDVPDGRFAPFIALEWLEGQNLSAHLEERVRRGQSPLPLKEALRLLTPVAHALQRAHRFPVENGEICILHRDVKPDNVFVCQVHGQTTTKILDFGIGKVKSATTQMVGQQSANASGLQAFSPAYGAPEQWLPKRFGQTGPWTDVWGFALTLVEVLSGRCPLEGDAAVLLGSAIDEGRRPTPRSEGVAVSSAVEAVFLKALAVDPAHRYRDVGEFWTELLRAAGLKPSGVSIPPPAHDPRLEGNVKVPSQSPVPLGSQATQPAAHRATATVPGVPDLELPAPPPRSAKPKSRHHDTLSVDRDALPMLASMPASTELDGVGLQPRSVPIRPRSAPMLPRDHDRGTEEVSRQLALPVKLVLFGVLLMATDFVYAHQMGEQLGYAGVRPYFIAGPLVLIGVTLGVVRLLRE